MLLNLRHKPSSVRPQTRGLRTAQTAGRRQSGQSNGRIGSTSKVPGVVVVVEAHDEDSAASSTATANGKEVKNHFNDDDGQSDCSSSHLATSTESTACWPSCCWHPQEIVVYIAKSPAAVPTKARQAHNAIHKNQQQLLHAPLLSRGTCRRR